MAVSLFAVGAAFEANPLIPTGVQANDILVLSGTSQNNLYNIVSPVPTGFTVIQNQVGFFFMWKRAAGTEGGTRLPNLNTNTNGPHGCVSVWRGAIASGDPFIVKGGLKNTVNATDSTHAITVPAGGALILAAGGFDDVYNDGEGNIGGYIVYSATPAPTVAYNRSKYELTYQYYSGQVWNAFPASETPYSIVVNLSASSPSYGGVNQRMGAEAYALAPVGYVAGSGTVQPVIAVC